MAMRRCVYLYLSAHVSAGGRVVGGGCIFYATRCIFVCLTAFTKY